MGGDEERSAEWLWTGIECGDHQFAICLAYLPVGKNREAQDLNVDALDRIEREGKILADKDWQILIMGDLNGHVGELIAGNTPGSERTGDSVRHMVTVGPFVMGNGSEKAKGLWTRAQGGVAR